MAAPDHLGCYLDACATAPPSKAVLDAIQTAHLEAWANPSSLHGPGLLAAESLERSRQTLADRLRTRGHRLTFCSGASEAIHLGLIGAASCLEPGRLVISAVEHPATIAAAARLAAMGWQVAVAPVDRQGLLDMRALEDLLAPPTRLVSLIWGQSEVGSLQPIRTIAALGKQAGVLLHVDAVQVLGHLPVSLVELPVDLLSCTAHKLQGPRGIGLLVHRSEVALRPLFGGAQEEGRRGGTEAVALAAGFAAALEEADCRLQTHGGRDPLTDLRDGLLDRLLALPGVELTGPDPRLRSVVDGDPCRLPHHISLLVRGPDGRCLPGRQLVRQLWREGVAVGSGSACSSGAAGATSPVLKAMGYSDDEAAGGLRLSLGPWLTANDLEMVPERLQRARAALALVSGP